MAKNKKEHEFVWPEFKNDKERIKAYSKRFADVSIAEAFEQIYNVKLDHTNSAANEVPKNLLKGDVISLKINSIGKNVVNFDAGNYKTLITTNVNLWKYNKFKSYVPSEPVKVKVIDVQKNKVTVDPIAALVEDWMVPIITNPNIQKVINNPQTIKVKNLQLTRGGFTGQAVIPSVTDFVGAEYTMDAFIPGSQIVLNITDNFEQFVGRDVDAFVLNYIQRPGVNQTGMSLICSVKEYLKFQGETNMISMFNEWCGETEKWKDISSIVYPGKVTGIINSSKKCGVFVEIPALKITGMISTSPEKLVNYKPQDVVQVKLTGFDEEKFYDPDTKQMRHVEPYNIRMGYLEKCNIKPILELA